MPGKKGEVMKTYIVIVLAIIAAGFAYFRFFYNKGPSIPGVRIPGLASVPVANLEVPKIDSSILRKKPMKEPAADEFRGADIRDLFSSFKTLSKIMPEETGKAVEIPRSSFVLKGTILGSENQIAIINSQFLRTGETISGYKVVRISKNEVLLSAGDQKILLEVISTLPK